MADKIVYYHGCFANYYNPDMGKSLVEVMEKNGFEVIVPDQKCCGMPQMANSAVEGARKNYDFNMNSLANAAAPGYDIITTCPSCNMMIKREGLPFFDSDAARFVGERVYDASQYLVKLYAQGRLDTRFGEIKLKVFYHNPCHLKVQNLRDSITILKMIPGIEIVSVNTNCCGMGGSYGMKKQNYARSTEIASKIWTEAKNSGADLAATECGGCGLQIEAGTGMKVTHPIILVNQAYKAFKEQDAA
ncbi:MAG: heterodisulfide reductase-related iron-sulfur binding cluster [Proteobacteria bacterium]|nr:heterodisulfide reductase-related iron-sulfur binding cluster [Pseudomonadota bacterium]